MTELPSILANENNGAITLKLPKRFVFDCQSQFRDAYQTGSPSHRYIVDMTATEYIDSAGLGMLTLLRKYCDEKEITLRVRSDEVKNLLKVVNFQKLFKIE